MMRTLLILPVTLFATLTFASFAHATGEELDSASSDALTKTQDMLKDPESRKAAIKASPEATQSDQALRQLAGSEDNVNAVYGLSSDIFADMVKANAGDGTAMQKQLDAAAKNPEAFLNSLSPQQKKKLEELAKQMGGGK